MEQVERRNRLRLLHSWLEARVAQGNTEAATHNAIGKIYVTLNKDPKQFLENNQFYEPRVLGAFCEARPEPVFLRIQEGSECDDELVAVPRRMASSRTWRGTWSRSKTWTCGSACSSPRASRRSGGAPSRRYLLDQVVQTAARYQGP